MRLIPHHLDLRCLLVAPVLACAPLAAANLLVDGGFESNALTTAGNSLNNFVGFQGVWGQENAYVIGTDGSISPKSGQKMLVMRQNSGVTTQIFQIVDVSSYASLIDSGSAQAIASAMLNARGTGRIGGIYLNFFTSASYSSILSGSPGASLNPLDSDASTWQMASATVSIPSGTRWMMFQIAYNNASLATLGGQPENGYADDASLAIIPAPGVAGLFGLCALLARGRRRGGVGLRRAS
jgi:hypothetical protein